VGAPDTPATAAAPGDEFTVCHCVSLCVTVCPTVSLYQVRGADEDNLALTRVVQRDLWVHQFPKDLLRPQSTGFFWWVWKSHMGHGLGAELHIMSVALSIALATNRILVPVVGSSSAPTTPGAEVRGRTGGGRSECKVPVSSPVLSLLRKLCWRLRQCRGGASSLAVVCFARNHLP